MRKIFTLVLTSLMSLALHGQNTHPILPLGSPAPNFELPGVDGKIHKLSDYASSRVLVVIFTCDHCPIAQMYENRIEKLYDDYSNRGVAIVAIQGNDPNATTIDEFDSSDLGDTLPEMKIRVQYKHRHYPYLYDGADQSAAPSYR
jgi:glutathione peroxidase-family protein